MTNTKPFLDMLSKSEGTYGKGDNGYNIIVGGQTFESYDTHPDVKVWIARINDYSTAAGRYQIIHPTFLRLCEKYGYSDFTPDTQDMMALHLISEASALDDVDEGRFNDAVVKCAHIWASLPGAGYGQHENALNNLRAAYQAAGGTIATEV